MTEIVALNNMRRERHQRLAETWAARASENNNINNNITNGSLNNNNISFNDINNNNNRGGLLGSLAAPRRMHLAASWAARAGGIAPALLPPSSVKATRADARPASAPEAAHGGGSSRGGGCGTHEAVARGAANEGTGGGGDGAFGVGVFGRRVRVLESGSPCALAAFAASLIRDQAHHLPPDHHPLGLAGKGGEGAKGGGHGVVAKAPPPSPGMGGEGAEDSFYVVDLGAVTRLSRHLQAAMPRVTPHYAVKCFPDPLVVRALAAEGCGFDCASAAELELVVAQGVCPSRVVFANPCKRGVDLAAMARHGVRHATFDCVGELEKMAAAAAEAAEGKGAGAHGGGGGTRGGLGVVLRLRADDPSARLPFGAKYGATADEVEHLVRAAHALPGLRLAGVSFHVGSGAGDPQAFRAALRAARRAVDLAADLAEHGEAGWSGGGGEEGEEEEGEEDGEERKGDGEVKEEVGAAGVQGGGEGLSRRREQREQRRQQRQQRRQQRRRLRYACRAPGAPPTFVDLGGGFGGGFDPRGRPFVGVGESHEGVCDDDDDDDDVENNVGGGGSVGGGVAAVVNAALDEFFPLNDFPNGLEVVSEPGRCLAEASAALVARVIGKRTRAPAAAAAAAAAFNAAAAAADEEAEGGGGAAGAAGAAAEREEEGAEAAGASREAGNDAKPPKPPKETVEKGSPSSSSSGGGGSGGGGGGAAVGGTLARPSAGHEAAYGSVHYYLADGLYGAFNAILYDGWAPTALPFRVKSAPPPPPGKQQGEAGPPPGDEPYGAVEFLTRNLPLPAETGGGPGGVGGEDGAAPLAVPPVPPVPRGPVTTVFGPTCDSLDMVFAGLPDCPALEVGDWLLFPNAGAYTMAGACDFNGVPATAQGGVRTHYVWCASHAPGPHDGEAATIFAPTPPVEAKRNF